ncbi:MAG: DNA mismatch endonuclease Vsr [Stappiaceae bacterium]
MADVLTPTQRTRCMSSVRTANTSPELLLRSLLHRSGLRYKLHSRNLPGKPDIVFPKRQAVIFVHGCYWHLHGCYRSSIPKTRQAFWLHKLTANKDRDKRVMKELIDSGWRVLFAWECALIGKSKIPDEEVALEVVCWLNSDVSFFELTPHSN